MAARGGLVAAVSKASKPKPKPKNHRFNRGRRDQSPSVKTAICFYHTTYGDKARRCEGDCAWPEN